MLTWSHSPLLSSKKRFAYIHINATPKSNSFDWNEALRFRTLSSKDDFDILGLMDEPKIILLFFFGFAWFYSLRIYTVFFFFWIKYYYIWIWGDFFHKKKRLEKIVEVMNGTNKIELYMILFSYVKGLCCGQLRPHWSEDRNIYDFFWKKTKHFSFIYKTGLNCNTDGSFCGGDLKNGSKYIKYMEWNVMREILKYFSNERNISRCIYKEND